MSDQEKIKAEEDIGEIFKLACKLITKFHFGSKEFKFLYEVIKNYCESVIE